MPSGIGGRQGPARVALARHMRRAALAFVFVTVVLDMLALGMIAPVLPRLLVELGGGDTAHGARVYGLFGMVWALMQFVWSPVLGALSDRYGRRPVILLSNLGLGLDYVLMALAPSVAWLFVGRVISGITAAVIPTAHAYIADVTPPERRSAAFGLIGVGFGVGFVLGPAAGGLLGAADPRLPFWVAAALSLANAAYGYFVLPESLPADRRSAFSWARANPVGALGLLRSHPELLGLSAASFLANVAHESRYAFVLYTVLRYGWGDREVGFALAGVGIGAVAVQGLLVGPAVARLGERATLVVGLLFGAIGFAMYGLAPTGPWFVAGVLVSGLWGLAAPANQGLMTRRVSPGEQGQLQGALGSLRGIAWMIGPGLFTYTFAFFVEPGRGWRFPGAPFVLAALLLAGSAGIAWRATRARA